MSGRIEKESLLVPGQYLPRTTKDLVGGDGPAVAGAKRSERRLRRVVAVLAVTLVVAFVAFTAFDLNALRHEIESTAFTAQGANLSFTEPAANLTVRGTLEALSSHHGVEVDDIVCGVAAEVGGELHALVTITGVGQLVGEAPVLDKNVQVLAETYKGFDVFASGWYLECRATVRLSVYHVLPISHRIHKTFSTHGLPVGRGQELQHLLKTFWAESMGPATDPRQALRRVRVPAVLREALPSLGVCVPAIDYHMSGLQESPRGLETDSFWRLSVAPVCTDLMLEPSLRPLVQHSFACERQDGKPCLPWQPLLETTGQLSKKTASVSATAVQDNFLTRLTGQHWYATLRHGVALPEAAAQARAASVAAATSAHAVARAVPRQGDTPCNEPKCSLLTVNGHLDTTLCVLDSCTENVQTFARMEADGELLAQAQANLSHSDLSRPVFDANLTADLHFSDEEAGHADLALHMDHTAQTARLSYDASKPTTGVVFGLTSTAWSLVDGFGAGVDAAATIRPVASAGHTYRARADAAYIESQRRAELAGNTSVAAGSRPAALTTTAAVATNWTSCHDDSMAFALGSHIVYGLDSPSPTAFNLTAGAVGRLVQGLNSSAHLAYSLGPANAAAERDEAGTLALGLVVNTTTSRVGITAHGEHNGFEYLSMASSSIIKPASLELGGSIVTANLHALVYCQSILYTVDTNMRLDTLHSSFNVDMSEEHSKTSSTMQLTWVATDHFEYALALNYGSTSGNVQLINTLSASQYAFDFYLRSTTPEVFELTTTSTYNFDDGNNFHLDADGTSRLQEQQQNFKLGMKTLEVEELNSNGFQLQFSEDYGNTDVRSTIYYSDTGADYNGTVQYSYEYGERTEGHFFQSSHVDTTGSVAKLALSNTHAGVEYINSNLTCTWESGPSTLGWDVLLKYSYTAIPGNFSHKFGWYGSGPSTHAVLSAASGHNHVVNGISLESRWNTFHGFNLNTTSELTLGNVRHTAVVDTSTDTVANRFNISFAGHNSQGVPLRVNNISFATNWHTAGALFGTSARLAYRETPARETVATFDMSASTADDTFLTQLSCDCVQGGAKILSTEVTIQQAAGNAPYVVHGSAFALNPTSIITFFGQAQQAGSRAQATFESTCNGDHAFSLAADVAWDAGSSQHWSGNITGNTTVLDNMVQNINGSLAYDDAGSGPSATLSMASSHGNTLDFQATSSGYWTNPSADTLIDFAVWQSVATDGHNKSVSNALRLRRGEALFETSDRRDGNLRDAALLAANWTLASGFGTNVTALAEAPFLGHISADLGFNLNTTRRTVWGSFAEKHRFLN